MPPDENVAPAVTMKAHQVLEARVAALEGKVKDLEEMAGKAKLFLDAQVRKADEKPKGDWNPFA